jgi:hypothetical protein
MSLITPALYIFRLINISSACCTRLKTIKNKLNASYNLLVNERIYRFLNDSVYPYDNNYNIDKPALMYNMDKNLFYNSTSLLQLELGTVVPIPILSLEIVDKNDRTLYDLTDFIESMRYIKLSDSYTKPSIGHIISVWQLHSKTILDTSQVCVIYINNNGDTVGIDIRNNTSLY